MNRSVFALNLAAGLPGGRPAPERAVRAGVAATLVLTPLLLSVSGNLCVVFTAVFVTAFATARAMSAARPRAHMPGRRAPAHRPVRHGRHPAARRGPSPLVASVDSPLAVAGLCRLLDVRERLGDVPEAIILDLEGFQAMDECSATLIASFGRDCRKQGCVVLCRGANRFARALLASFHPGEGPLHIEDLQGGAEASACSQ